MKLRGFCFLISIIVVFTLSSVTYAGSLVVFLEESTLEGNYEVRDSKVFIPVEMLLSFAKAFTMTTSGDAGYLVNARKDIAFLDGTTGNVTLNFLKDYPGACYLSDAGTKTSLMVELGFIQEFLGLRSYTRNESVFLGRSFPKMVGFDRNEDGILVLFDRDLSEAMLNIVSEGDGAVLEIFPMEGMADISGPFDSLKIDFDPGNKMVRIFMRGIEAYRLRSAVLKNSVRVSFGPPPGYDLYERLAEGLLWYRKSEDIDGSTMTLNVLEIDPERFEIKLELANGKLGGGEKVSNMVARTGAVAGLNGGYFDPATMFPIGFIVKDGRVIHLPFSIRPVFMKTKDGEYSIRRVRYEMNVRLGHVLFYVKGINTPAKGDALLFTSEYANDIPLREGFRYYIGNGTWIEAEGYVQHAEPGRYVFIVSYKYADLLDGVKEGDPFRIIEISDAGSTRELDFAVEGGPLLIQNGAPVPDYAEEKALYSSYVTDSYAPRTVVGITKSGKILFITISGEEIRGPNYDKLVELMLRYDLKDAMALDGGGSSALVIKGKVVNKEPGKEIPVPTGLLVFRRE